MGEGLLHEQVQVRHLYVIPDEEVRGVIVEVDCAEPLLTTHSDISQKQPFQMRNGHESSRNVIVYIDGSLHHGI